MLHSGLDRRPAEDLLTKYGAWRCADAGPSLRQGGGSGSAIHRVTSHALIDISEDAEITAPKQVCLDESSSPDLCYEVGSSSCIGKRTKMEDRLVIADLTSETAFAGSKRALLMAVFDGHGGHEAAEHLASTFRARLLASAALPSRDYGAALRNVLLEAEATFMQDYFTSGTTALVVLMVDRALHIANVGDCRAVVCDESEARALTWDHKPTNQIEKARLEASGAKLSSDGYVEVDGARVDGIALSRALGGAPIKQAAAQASSSSPCISPVVSGTETHAPPPPQQQQQDPAGTSCSTSSCSAAPTERDTPFLRYDPGHLLDAGPSPSGAGPSGPASPFHHRAPGPGPALAELGSQPSTSQVASRQQSGMLSESSVVIAEPELFQYSIHQGSEFLILGSDGLWDVVRNGEAVSRVHRWLGEEQQSVGEAASALVEYAQKMGSHDNVSVLLLRFSSRPLQAAATPRHVNSALRKTRSVAVMAEQQQQALKPQLHRVESSL